MALGLSVSVALTTGLLFEAWSRKTGNQQKKEVYRFFGVSLLLSLFTGLVAEAVYRVVCLMIPTGSLISNLGICVITAVIFLIALGGVGRLFRIKEIQILYENLSTKVMPWIKKEKKTQGKNRS